MQANRLAAFGNWRNFFTKSLLATPFWHKE